MKDFGDVFGYEWGLAFRFLPDIDFLHPQCRLHRPPGATR